MQEKVVITWNLKRPLNAELAGAFLLMGAFLMLGSYLFEGSSAVRVAAGLLLGVSGVFGLKTLSEALANHFKDQ